MADSIDARREPSKPPRARRQRGAQRRLVRLARRALAPVERFLAIEAASGILLLATTALALLWANSPWRESYAALWHVPLGVMLPGLSFVHDLHFWINDGVMTVFFFVVGIEVRREIQSGDLSDRRRAALPLVAAVGGMLVPSALFFAINRGHASADGWGIPMATDIAFAVGVLALLGKRVPPTLRVLLLAVAVIDDVGAILVIALFYSSALAPVGFLIAGVGLAAIRVMQRLGIGNPWLYVPAGAVAWAGTYAAGVHPTLVGVVVGMMTPVEGGTDSTQQSPAVRIEQGLHGWVAFGAMPLFALANAGVAFGDTPLTDDSLRVWLGVVLGLVLGKPLGIVGFSWLATRVGAAALPSGTTWAQMGLLGVVAGIGFTMSIFIARLALHSDASLEAAKLGVLAASGAAAILAYAVGRMVLRVGGR